MRVLVTGGSGSLGREVVEAAIGRGHIVRVASRRSAPVGLPQSREWAQMDMESGNGIAAALTGVDAVIHAATDPRRPDVVDVSGTRVLVAAARDARVQHLVYVSIVGIEHIPVKYYAAKLAAEEIVRRGSVPFSILRATQFHSFADQILTGLARVPLVLPVPRGFGLQSVDTSEVAQRLMRCIEAGASGASLDFGGPEVMTLAEAADQWKRARGIRKPIIQLPVPGRVAAALRAGKNTVSGGERGKISWSEWLATHVASNQ